MAQELPPWDKLKLWVARKHDQLEVAYKETNFSSDAVALGSFRQVFQAMKDIEEQEAQKQVSAKPPVRTDREKK